MTQCTSIHVTGGRAHACRKDHVFLTPGAIHRCECNQTWPPALPPIDRERTYVDPDNPRPTYMR